jgi:hypothetical protein
MLEKCADTLKISSRVGQWRSWRQPMKMAIGAHNFLGDSRVYWNCMTTWLVTCVITSVSANQGATRCVIECSLGTTRLDSSPHLGLPSENRSKCKQWSTRTIMFEVMNESAKTPMKGTLWCQVISNMNNNNRDQIKIKRSCPQSQVYFSYYRASFSIVYASVDPELAMVSPLMFTLSYFLW